jgi:hypothetical protein
MVVKENLEILRDVNVCSVPEYGKVTFRKPSVCVYVCKYGCAFG